MIQDRPTDGQLLKKKATKDDVQYDENDIGTVLEQALSVMPKNINEYDDTCSGTYPSAEKISRYR